MAYYKEPPAQVPSTDHCELVEINAQFAPYLVNLLERRKEPRYWVDGDFSDALTALCNAQIGVMMGCAADMLENQDRLYRMLDNSINGTTYTVTGTDPVTGKALVSPAIPDVPAVLNPARDAMRVALDELPGMIDVGWFGLGGQKATLADLLAALRIGNNQTAQDLGDEIRNLIAGTGSTAVVADFVEDVINNSAQTAAEGGQLAVQVATTAANIAMTGAMMNKLDRLIDSLDGGGLLRPGDNVLQALRGDTEASAARNVIDAAQDAVLANKLDTLITEVSKINDSNADLTDILAKLEEMRALL
jgi:hypothetical protein